MTQAKLPTAAELAILRVLWDKGPSSVRSVLGHLTHHRDIGYTTVLKQMQIMTGKDLVVKDATVRPQIYSTASPRHQTRRGLVRRLADGAFDGSAGDLALYVLKMKRISAADRARIRTLLDEMGGDGFGRVDRFPGGIAYLGIDAFSSGPVAMARAEEVMRSFQDASAIVFDLRGNGGGDGEMVEKLESYLFAEPTNIMNSVRRGGPGEPPIVVESWTTINELSARMSLIPVFIFIDPFTGSASEAFAFGLKNVGRATLLGQTSAGAGHRVSYERLPGNFALGLPVGAAISPKTGKGWETVGVVPDVETSPDATLEELIEMVRVRIR